MVLKVYMKVMYHKPQVLVDQYTDSDEPSVGHRKLFFDIEVESQRVLM